MLLNDLYTLEAVGASHIVLALNAAHPIFRGHFPGQPVVPGACELQIVREMLSHVAGKEYRLQKADRVKFLTPIDPRRYPRLELTLRYEQDDTGKPSEPLRLTAALASGDTTFLKFTGTFRAE